MDGIERSLVRAAPGAVTPMRVAVDGFNLAMSRGTGVATYARVLAACLGRMGHQVDLLYGMNISANASPLMQEVVFFDGLNEERGRNAPGFGTRRWLRENWDNLRGLDARVIALNGAVDARGFAGKLPPHDRILNIPDLFQRAARHFRRTGRFLRIRVPDAPRIMHWTYPLPIHMEGSANVYTLHDLVPLRLPHTTLDDKGYYLRLIRGCVAPGRYVCTVSDASRIDIETLFPESAGRVTNTYEAFDPPAAIAQMPEQEIAARLSGLFDLQHRGYFLFFGSLEPKKNIGRLIEAYLSAGIETPLVLVGAQAWKSEGELRLLKAREGRPLRAGEGRIVQIDYLPFDLLMTLVRGARAVAFPSLSEGFGLPLLEAMSLGTPTLTSNTASLPEIAGQAALLVDPYDVRAITAGLRRLDSDEALRANLSAHGPAQAALFGMDAYQPRLAAFYESVLQG